MLIMTVRFDISDISHGMFIKYDPAAQKQS